MYSVVQLILFDTVKRVSFKRILTLNEICKLLLLRAAKDTEKPIREYHKMGSVGNSVRKYTRREKKKEKDKWGICPSVHQ